LTGIIMKTYWFS